MRQLTLWGTSRLDVNGRPTGAYTSWYAMKHRCTSPSHKQYAAYGGRGITVCDRWMSFDNFFEDMGDRPKGHTLDRIDVNGNYEPSNCRWLPKREQYHNMRSNRMLTHNGRTMTLSQWAEEIGMWPHSLTYRLDKAGWSVEKALTTPKSKAGLPKTKSRKSRAKVRV